MAGRTRGRIVRSTRRLTSWFFVGPVNASMSAAGGTLMSSLNASGLAQRPFTVVRTHLQIMVRSDQSAAVEVQGGALGLAVVSDEAVAVGVTAVPTPITEMGSALWFVHQPWMAGHNDLTDRALPVQIFNVDSKAMRKVEFGQDIVMVGELSTVVGSGAIISVIGRFLVKNN